MPKIYGLEISLNDHIQEDEVLELYRANGWSAVEKPDKLLPALRNAHSLVTARLEGRLIGLGNAISDGFLVVYYPQLLVHPEYQRKGIGRKMTAAMQKIYGDFHQQMLTADEKAIEFYKTLGFQRAGKTVPMWVYAGSEH